MSIRISGLASGLDTESIVQQLVSAYSVKKNSYVKAQTKLSWKQDAWKDLNKKIYSLYSKIGNLRYESAYNTKKATASDSTKVKVTASANAVNGTQTLKILNTAKTGYLTGGELDAGTSAGTTLSQLTGFTGDGTVRVTSGGTTTNIAVTGDTTIAQFVSDLNDAGVKASYDATNRRFFISANDSGAANDFTLAGADQNGTNALSALKLNSSKEWSAYARNTEGNAYYNADGTTNGTYSEENTKNNLTNILAELSQANANIESVRLPLATEQANLTKYKSQLSYVQSYQTVASVEELAVQMGMTDDAIKDMRTLAQMSDSDLEKSYLVDNEGNLIYDDTRKPAEVLNEDYDHSLYQSVKGSDLLTKREKEAGLTNADGELDKNAASAYVKSRQAVTAYQENDPVDQDTVDKVREIYSGTDSEYANLSEYMSALDGLIFTSEGNIADYNQTIADNNRVLNKYATVNNGEDAAALEARIRDSLSRDSGAVRIKGEDAEISLNGASFRSSTSTFQINGLTIEALAVTGAGEEITITTQNDVDGVYNKVKDFIKQYNELINEMTSLYGAASAKGYEPLTTEEKDAMSDKEVEEWEKKIKDSILRRDDTLGSVKNIMQTAMSKAYSVNGKNYSLASFGIKTLGILAANEHEENAFHIDGDPDDESSSSSSDKLRAMIQDDPEVVTQFMKQLTTGLYDALDAKMKSTTLSSAYTVYNDKQMKTQYNEYTTTIKKWEDKVSAMEESYYKKFAAMESALTQLQSSTSALSGLLGS
ncbi:MAG: flagellar filament capping protein FliD [Lachnospiraceae bacterium]|nr:flagellar filament capping protein FliD [Lachnospiraceae bacterium]